MKISLLEVASSSLASSDSTSSSPSGEFDLEAMLIAVIEWIKTNGVKLIFALIVLFIYFKIVNLISKSFRKRLSKRKNVDETIAIASHKVISIFLKIVGVLIFLGYVGVDTAGVGAIVGSLSIVFGLALQGSLANVAGWVVIIVMRPFKLGDYIESQEYAGTVTEIRSFYTYLLTPDNKVVMIPNGILSNDEIINYSKEKLRRVDITFPVRFNEDIDKVKSIIKEVVQNHNLVLKKPEESIRANNITQSSIEIVCKVWVNNKNYWDVKYDLIESIKKEFDRQNIKMAYNQIDVHINNQE